MSTLRRWTGSVWEEISSYHGAVPILGGISYGIATGEAFTGTGTTGQVLTSGGTGAPVWKNDGTLVGEVKMWTSSIIPIGWLNCDGTTKSRITYAALNAHFAADGYKPGVGDGSTTFNLPDFRDRFPIGAYGSPVGSIGGENMHTLTFAEMPSHTHGQVAGWGVGSGLYPYWDGNASRSAYGMWGTSSAGSDAAHNNVPAFTAVNFIIKY